MKKQLIFHFTYRGLLTRGKKSKRRKWSLNCEKLKPETSLTSYDWWRYDGGKKSDSVFIVFVFIDVLWWPCVRIRKLLQPSCLHLDIRLVCRLRFDLLDVKSDNVGQKHPDYTQVTGVHFDVNTQKTTRMLGRSLFRETVWLLIFLLQIWSVDTAFHFWNLFFYSRYRRRCCLFMQAINCSYNKRKRTRRHVGYIHWHFLHAKQ